MIEVREGRRGGQGLLALTRLQDLYMRRVLNFWEDLLATFTSSDLAWRGLGVIAQGWKTFASPSYSMKSLRVALGILPLGMIGGGGLMVRIFGRRGLVWLRSSLLTASFGFFFGEYSFTLFHLGIGWLGGMTP